MSVSIKYKGIEIASASTETTKTIKTAGKYCEADILVENTPDSGDAPVINPLSVTENGTYTAPSGVDGYSPIDVNVPQGITPTGNINITDTNVTDVTNYATATVVDADLIASNIKKNINILGVVGSFEGGGGSGWDIQGATVTEITIGANTVANGEDLRNYFGGALAPVTYLLLDAPTTYNQIAALNMFNTQGGALRYRNGWTYAQFSTAYDALLIEGTKYLKIEYS